MRPGGLLTARPPTDSSALARAGLVLLCALVSVLTACSSPGPARGLGAANPSAAPAGSTAPPSSLASVAISPAARSTVRPDAAVQVKATLGMLTSVVVRAKSGGEPLAGTLSADGMSWTAAPGLLRLSTSYVVDAKAVDSRGVSRTVTSSFATLKPKAVLRTVVTPGGGSLVGAGMPIMVSFTSAVTDRAAVEARLRVTMSQPVDGAWHWFSSKVVHFRPKSFWPAGEKVTVELNLTGVDAGGGVWGDRDRTFAFEIGDALVSTVDVTNHTMTVTRNGKVLRVIPITTGKAGFLTRGGTKVIMTKERFRVMDSTTVDIPVDSPDAYRLKVEYALRLTYSGEFVHAAPWSVAHQGKENVSHGCTGMSLANAAWFYSMSRVGDVVKYIHSQRSLELGNGYTDWNISWSAWQAGSAL